MKMNDKKIPRKRSPLTKKDMASMPPKGAAELPSVEKVAEWVRKDLQSAHYLLGIVLMRHPEIVNELAGSIYQTVKEKEKSAAIDHVSGPTG